MAVMRLLIASALVAVVACPAPASAETMYLDECDEAKDACCPVPGRIGIDIDRGDVEDCIHHCTIRPTETSVERNRESSSCFA